MSNPVPTGSVTLYNGVTAISSPFNLQSDGSYNFQNLTNLPQGVDNLTAKYSGDANYPASVSPVLIQQVNSAQLPAPNVSINSSLNPSVVGQAVNIFGVVTPQ